MSGDQRAAGGFLRVIAAFKFLKALILVCSGLAALELLHPAVVDLLKTWAEALPLGPEQHVAQKLLGWITGLSSRRIKALGLGAFAFASIFITEGTGLWLRKLWAEWLTVLATALLIPMELWEVVVHTTPPKIFVLLLNIVVVVYLVRQIKTKPHKSDRA
jgi:uncharacterized membrane protein (DUF2068 family)